MKKGNIITVVLLVVLFINVIYVNFSSNYKIKNVEKETTSLKIQLRSLKAENEALKNTNYNLIETNSKTSKMVINLKNIIN